MNYTHSLLKKYTTLSQLSQYENLYFKNNNIDKYGFCDIIKADKELADRRLAPDWII